MALVHSRSCLQFFQTFARRVSWAPWKHPWPQTSRSFRKGWPWGFFWGSSSESSNNRASWMEDIQYFLTIFFPRTFSQWYREKNGLTALISWCVIRMPDLWFLRETSKDKFHIFVVSECLSWLPDSQKNHSTSMFKTITINYPLFVFQKGVCLAITCCFNHFQDVVFAAFPGNKSWVPWKQIINVSSWRLRTKFLVRHQTEIKDGKSLLVNRWFSIYVFSCWSFHCYVWLRSGGGFIIGLCETVGEDWSRIYSKLTNNLQMVFSTGISFSCNQFFYTHWVT